jgi:cell division septation protein DedD
VFAAQVPAFEGASSAPTAAEPKSAAGYRVQLGAFIDQKLAASLAARAEADLGSPTYVVFDRPFYRVRAGDFRELSEAEALKTVAIGKGYQDARIAREEIVISD